MTTSGRCVQAAEVAELLRLWLLNLLPLCTERGLTSLSIMTSLSDVRLHVRADAPQLLKDLEEARTKMQRARDLESGRTRILKPP